MTFKMKRRRREKGAIIITVALLLFFLLGFMGIAVDLGHMFVIRTELQTSMDACALAGAQELDGQPNALVRATNAGIAAGNANHVDLQSGTWNGKPGVSSGDIAFLDQDHVATTDDTKARFVRCDHTQQGTPTALLGMLSTNSAAPAVSTMNVNAFAEATTTPSQTTCPMPLGLLPKAGAGKPDYGFARGDWVTLLSSTPTAGNIGWFNLDGSKNASETEKEVNGFCGTRLHDTLGTPGVEASVADAWNTRFGIYKGNDKGNDNGKDKDGPDIHHPDYTGYVYIKPNGKAPGTWAPGRNAFPDFINKRQAFANCAATYRKCTDVTGLKLNPSADLIEPDKHKRYGTNRRLVTVPVIGAGNKVDDYVCMLLLQPISSPMVDVQLEYLGNSADPASPCTANGLPGGTAGPLVPVLVR
jgi:Flp pilus assembly protein TadG